MIAVTGTPRSLFPEGVEVHSRHLTWTEQTKIIEILRRYTSVVTQGIQIGLGVTINAINLTLIDVAAGSGYTRGAVYVTLAAPSIGVALSDPTLGVVNIVSMVAVDSNLDPEPHEFDGTVHYTKVDTTATLEIVTEAVYNLMSSANKDLRCIIARVTGHGAGVDLVPTDVVSPSPFVSAMNAVKTGVPGNITGISIAYISPNTVAGTGELTFTVAGTFLKWKAPGGAYGAVVDISGYGYHTLVSGASMLVILRNTVALPGGNIIESVTVSDIYEQAVKLLTGVDLQHRNILGSGLVTPFNAHGLLLPDIGGDPEVEEARGSQPLLDDRLDVSLNEDGTLKPSAVAELINHNQLLDMPDGAATPATAVPDHDARYGDLDYLAGPSVRANPVGSIITTNESHRDSITRINGEMSKLIVNTDPVKGDAIVGHNYDALTVGTGWSNDTVRSFVNQVAALVNTINKVPLGLVYDPIFSAIVIPKQVVNCAGKIRYLNSALSMNPTAIWVTYLDAGQVRLQRTAYYVYLNPGVGPAPMPRITTAVPINGYHPDTVGHFGYVYIGSFVTDFGVPANVIPFRYIGGKVLLTNDSPTVAPGTSGMWAALTSRVETQELLVAGTNGVVPATARAVVLTATVSISRVSALGYVTARVYFGNKPGLSATQYSYRVQQGSTAAITGESLNESNSFSLPLDSSLGFYDLISVDNLSGHSVYIELMRMGWEEDLLYGTVA